MNRFGVSVLRLLFLSVIFCNEHMSSFSLRGLVKKYAKKQERSNDDDNNKK